ncbi:MobQ family relaxase [Micavibrio aeruginosavorus]|uniref:MobA/MobL family protein n=1 Tax=Micavibrio aeruginosavorus (strain ARL-13) TaxID=856793 RepID=G2KRL1_MICAA|nr:MobQ family relaxase [Micavibrio aeruginosavorus]AEP09573.1 mobA/MobL family protein [Micavibrio aeruginosavorus ARL-13]
MNNDKSLAPSPINPWAGERLKPLAIYHCSLRTFSRADGHSAVAAAAYRSGSYLKDERTGTMHRYEKRKGVKAAFILAPPDVPEKFFTRAFLWNAAEAAENRKNARVAREAILALPHELNDKARAELARDMGLYLMERYRVAVDVAIHGPVAGDGHDPRNHHAHLLFTTREITGEGLGAKTRILDDKATGPQEVEIIRAVWETLANDALKRAGFPDAKIDRRTLEAQGVDRIPQTHEGKASTNAAAYESLLAKEFRKADKDEESDDESGEEEGKGEKDSSSGSSSRGQAAPLQSKAREDSTGRKIDYPALDKKQTRSIFNDEIKALNEKRAAFGDKPLLEQIDQLDRLMERLDRRVEKLQALETKTSLKAAIRQSIASVVKLAADLLVNRKAARAAINITAEEKQARKERQNIRYGRTYREGLHHQIREMKQNMAIVEAKKEDFYRYKSFVDSIEKELKKPSPSVAASFKEQSPPPARQITDREVNLKLHLKAEMIRSQIPEQYRAPSALKGDRKTLRNSTAINQILQTKTASITKPEAMAAKPDTADRKNWFIPASDKMRSFQRSIEAALEAQRKAAPQQRPSNTETQSSFSKAQEVPHKAATYSQVREKVRAEAEAKRAKVPPEYRAEPYERADSTTEKPQTKKQSAFSEAAKAENEQTKPRMSDAFNMKSGAKKSRQTSPGRKPDEKKPETK